MKNQLLKLLFLFTIIFASVSLASAWDDTGHKLVTYIAWQQMSPNAREQAVKLLLSAPEDSDLSVFYLQDSRSEAAKQRELFMIASTWADIVRDRKFKNRFEKYHKGDWHYADTFWRESNGKADILNDFEEPKGKAVEQLYAFEKILRDNSVSDETKAIALAWILHLGGDIHQPLHTSARVTELEPKGDQGGNLFLLSPKDAVGENRLNLHWYWDSIIGRNIPRFFDACDSEYIPPIAQEIMKNYPSPKFQTRLEIGQFDKWQQESFQIASTKLYPPTLIRYEVPSENYKKQAFQIAQEQIALAGYRLGQMLNQIFDNSGVSRESFDKNKIEFLEQSKLIGDEMGQGENDAWIAFQIRTALAKAENIRDLTIRLDVKDSVLTLRATVPTQAQKDTILNIAKKLNEVKSVKDFLRIPPSR